MAHKDPVSPEDHEAVLRRDGFRCVAIALGASDECRDMWGRPLQTNSGYQWRKLELDHIREQAMIGKRGKSQVRWMVAGCPWHHRLGNPPWLLVNRAAVREYLEQKHGAEEVA
jgi:hypothetical protein